MFPAINNKLKQHKSDYRMPKMTLDDHMAKLEQ